MALALTAGLQSKVLANYADWYAWLPSLVVTLSVGAIVGLVVARLAPRQRGTPFAMAAASVGIVSLLIAPSLWAVSTIWYGGETRTPTAGPHPLADRGASANFVRDAAPLLDYLRSHQDTAKYLVASADEEFAAVCDLAYQRTRDRLGRLHGERPRLEHDAAESARRCRRGAVLSVGADEPPED